MADKADKKAPSKADKSTEQTPQSQEQRKRRILRAAEPTTLREQSEKAQAKSAQPRENQLGRALVAPFRWLGRFLARIFRPLGKFKVIRAIGYVIAPPYVRNSWKELKQVTWPDRRQTRRLTFAVVLFSLMFGAIVAGVDYGLDKLFRAFILNQ